MTNIVAGIDVSRPWSGEDIIDMARRGKLRELTFHGYVAQANDDGTVRLIPFEESTHFRSEVGKPVISSVDLAETMLADVNANHPIVRRTPQQRVASMFLRLMAEYKRSGTLPGVPPELIKRVMGGAWREGEPLTDEVIRAVAAHYLGIGEVDNKRSKANHAIRDRTPEVAK